MKCRALWSIKKPPLRVSAAEALPEEAASGARMMWIIVTEFFLSYAHKHKHFKRGPP